VHLILTYTLLAAGAGPIGFVFQWLRHTVGIDRAIAYSILARVWSSSAGIVTVLLIARFLTPAEQGYYYTFSSLVALQIVFELGGKALAVKRVTENKGKRTSGVDHVLWSTPQSKLKAIASLQRRGYRPLPLSCAGEAWSYRTPCAKWNVLRAAPPCFRNGACTGISIKGNPYGCRLKVGREDVGITPIPRSGLVQFLLSKYFDSRKNSRFVGNARGGRTAAILASLTSTCRRHTSTRRSTAVHSTLRRNMDKPEFRHGTFSAPLARVSMRVSPQRSPQEIAQRIARQARLAKSTPLTDPSRWSEPQTVLC
jgi:hypothetical protein